jgi:hypothetical protein
MKSVKDILAVVLGLAAVILAAYKFYLFVITPGTGPNSELWWAIGATLVFIACGLIYFVGHVNKEEEIHITQ